MWCLKGGFSEANRFSEGSCVDQLSLRCGLRGPAAWEGGEEATEEPRWPGWLAGSSRGQPALLRRRNKTVISHHYVRQLGHRHGSEATLNSSRRGLRLGSYLIYERQSLPLNLRGWNFFFLFRGVITNKTTWWLKASEHRAAQWADARDVYSAALVLNDNVKQFVSHLFLRHIAGR